MGRNARRIDRRYFLKGAAVAGLGAAFGGALAGCGTQQAAPSVAAPTKAPAAAAPTAAPAAAPTAAPAAAAPAAAPKLNWPEKGKTLTITVPWPPGNSPDMSSRLLADMLKKDLDINVEVVNKDGAGSQVGTTEFVKLKPDGYNILAQTVPTCSLIYLDPDRKATYSRKSFTPIAAYALDPYGLAVQASAPWKNLKDLIEDAKANPGKIKVGTNGYMNGTHLLVARLMKLTGVKFAVAHFDGGSPNMTALLGGHSDVACMGTPMVAQIKAGKLRGLAVSTETQNELFPGMPTFIEQGYNLTLVVVRGMVGPAGVPKEIVDVIAGVIKSATTDANFKAKMAAASSSIHYMAPEQYAADWDRQDKEVEGIIAEVKASN